MAKSMFNLSDFKATIKSNGVAKDTRFEVIMHPPAYLQLNSKELSLRCHTASMPAFNVKTRDYIIGQGQIRKMPVNFDNGGTIELSFYNNYKGTVYSDLVEWTKLVSPNISENDHTINFVSVIYGKIVVQQLDERDNVRQGWELRDAFPTSVEVVPLDSGHIDHVQLVKVHISYRYAMTLKDVQTLESNPLSTAVFNDRNNSYASRVRAARSLTTAKGAYAKRNRGYSPFDTPDPTMIPIVADTGKGKGLTPEQYYNYVTEFVMTSRIKGIGIYTEDQTDWMLNSLPEMTTALGTQDRRVITDAFHTFSSSYNDIRSKANSFFGDVSSCVGSYDSIKNSLSSTDALVDSMLDLQFVYKDVYNTQLDMDKSFNYMNDVVSSMWTDVSFDISL